MTAPPTDPDDMTDYYDDQLTVEDREALRAAVALSKLIGAA